MGVPASPPWNVTPQEAIALQKELASRVITVDRLGPVNRVAGVDVGFREQGTVTRAAVAVLSYPELALMETAVAHCPTGFPYVPGLLSFREIPAILEALEKLSTPPDLLLCDGQGIAHPRRIGIASHLGLLVDIPSIGVGKTRLWGKHEEPPEERGAWTPLRDGDEIIGAVLRTRAKVKPLYVSPGHRIGLETSIRTALENSPPGTADSVVAINTAAVEIARKRRDTLTWRYPVAVSGSFGLLHGFGFASVLNEIGLPQMEIPAALLFFNIGVEIGQILFVILVLLMVTGLSVFGVWQGEMRSKSRFSVPDYLMRPAAYLVGVLAAYWTIERIAGFVA